MQPSSASPSGTSSWRTTREEYEYIVIGTGAGGGPVAANLAKAGRKVLVLEAGGDARNPTSEFRYNVPGGNPRNDVELGWSYWVNSRAREADRKEQNFYVPEKGLYYPRGTSIGGSTNVNAMIALYPDNDDWSEIATITGDRSWAPEEMRGYFQRLEQVRYKPADGDKERHGFSGWLPLEQVGTRGNLFKDPWLANYLVSRLRGETNGDGLKAALDSGGDFRIDPNDWSCVSERRTGLVDPPRTSDRGARRGTRELLLKTAEEHRANFRIETDALVTGLIFDETHRTRVIGVRFLSGPHLYGASLLAEQFASRLGIPREVFASREVILAAGAFNSPQILMLSGIGPDEELRKHGIDVRVNLPGVGANLQDRLETGVVVKIPFEPSMYKSCTWGADGDPCLAEYARDDAEYRTRLSRQFYMVQRSDPSRTVPNLVIFGFVGRFRGRPAARTSSPGSRCQGTGRTPPVESRFGRRARGRRRTSISTTSKMATAAAPIWRRSSMASNGPGGSRPTAEAGRPRGRSVRARNTRRTTSCGRSSGKRRGVITPRARIRSDAATIRWRSSMGRFVSMASSACGSSMRRCFPGRPGCSSPFPST